MQIVQAADFQYSGDELTLEILCAAEVDVRSADIQPFFPKVDFSLQPIQCNPRRDYITSAHRFRALFFSRFRVVCMDEIA